MPAISQFPVNIGAELSPSTAYFLGGIISSMDFHEENGSKVWLSTARYNADKKHPESPDEHLGFLVEIASSTAGKYFSKDELAKKHWFASNKRGFGFAFYSKYDVSVADLLVATTTLLTSADDKILRAFLVGAFDGRACFDINQQNKRIRKYVLDCPKESAPLIMMVLDKFGIKYDYNTARERKAGGEPRESQLRINGNNVPVFMKEVGLISPARLRSIENSPSISSHRTIKSDLLAGLITYQFEETNIPTRKIKPLRIEQKQSENLEDDLLMYKTAEQTLPKNTDLSYSGKPKVKNALINTRGRKTYSRDPRISARALTMADYMCEFDPTHTTFTRKVDGLPYTEPHHLVPMGFSSIFDVSLDIEENIVSLCSNCHNHLHYGKDIQQILEKIYHKRKELLKSVGIDVSFEELLAMYK